jgi:hypothetical protein
MRLGAAAVLVLFLAAACAGTTTREKLAAPMRTYTATQTRIVGAGPAQTRVLRGILGELAPSVIATVRVEEKTAAWKCDAPPGSLALTVDTPPNIRGDWDASLLVNLYFDAASRLNLRRDDVMLLGNASACIQRIGVPVSTAPKNLAPLRHALASTGVSVVELRHVAGGVALTVQTADPAAFLRDHFEAIRHQLTSLSPRLFVFALADATGRFVAGMASVGSQGESRVLPALAACGHIPWSFNPPANQPPCPV